MQTSSCDALRRAVVACRRVKYLALLGLGFILVQPLGAQDKFTQPHYLEVSPVKRVRLEMSQTQTAPNLTVRRWGVMVAIPPEFDGQGEVRAAIRMRDNTPSTVTIIRETGPLQQQAFLVHLPIEKPKRGSQAEVHAIYDLTPMKRHLKDGKTLKPVTPLEPKERAVYLAETNEYDFKSDEFEKWLGDRRLIRTIRETELTFARRTFHDIARSIRYEGIAGIEKASTICTRGNGACGGLSNLFVAVMRANRIPARVLYGRLMNESVQTADEIHCRAEFYADGIGWVPVDVAAATGPEKNPDHFFGRDPGDLLVLHFDAISWGTDRTALQSMWFGFSDQEGTWDGSSRKIHTKLTNPDVELGLPR